MLLALLTVNLQAADQITDDEPLYPEDIGFQKVSIKAEERKDWALDFVRVETVNGKTQTFGSREYREGYGTYRFSILQGPTHFFAPELRVVFRIKDGILGKVYKLTDGSRWSSGGPRKGITISDKFQEVYRLKLTHCSQPVGEVSIRWYIRWVNVKAELAKNESYAKHIELRKHNIPIKYAEGTFIPKDELERLIQDVSADMKKESGTMDGPAEGRPR